MAQQDKPKISLNLDALEREGSVPDPFWVTLKGKPFRLVDPHEIAWAKLVRITANPADFLSAAISEDKRDEFMRLVDDLPGWKVNKLADGYREHYGLPSDPEAPALPIS